MKYLCPICGFKELTEPAYDEEGNNSSYEICDSCGNEFGYQDASETKEELIKRWKYLRENWLKEGSLWRFPEYKPKNWNLEKQLKNLDKFQQKFKKTGKFDFRVE